MMRYEFVDIKTVQTEKQGRLSFFEAGRETPFDIRRIYYITDVPAGAERGAHAHKTLRQLLFCPYGSVTVTLTDGSREEKITLDSPQKGLLLYPGLWRNLLWNRDGSVLCVAASDYYDESDYIRDYGDYLKYIRGELT